MPCSFGVLQHARSGPDAHAADPVGVTVADRCIPLVTAAYGTQVARPARTTSHARGGDGSQLDKRLRPVLCDHGIAAKSPKGWRQVRHEAATAPDTSPA
jgi:hypothetical protein